MDLRLFLALSVLLVVEAFNSLQEEFPSDNLEQDDHFGRKGRGEYWYNLKHEKTLICIELFSSVIFVSSCNFSGMPDYTWKVQISFTYLSPNGLKIILPLTSLQNDPCIGNANRNGTCYTGDIYHIYNIFELPLRLNRGCFPSRGMYWSM